MQIESLDTRHDHFPGKVLGYGKTFEVVMFEGTRAECKRFIEHAIDSAIAHPERSVTVTGDGGRVTVQSDGGGRYSLRLDHLEAEA